MNLKSFISVAALLNICYGCLHEGKSENDKPNILFILVDDLGWADLSFNGSQFYETPNIDKLAASGMVFTDAYAASPICSPSRAAIVTGKYPARLNLTDYIPGNQHYGPHKNQKLASLPFKLQVDLEEYTIAEAFKDAGYHTFFAGKWHLGEEDKYYPQHQGFDINKGGNKTGTPAGGYFAPYNNPQLEDGVEGEYLTDRLTDETIDFIRKNKDTAFFSFLSFYTVHLPMQGKPDKVEKYRNKLAQMNYDEEEFVKTGETYHKQWQNMTHYAAMVESLDENVGRLLQVLEQENLSENTIVVFTSDNGGMATSNRTDNIPTTNLPLRAGKGYLYEGGIREPLIIQWSGKIEAGSSADFPATGTDFYPTLLDLTGIQLKPEQHQDGISLKPLLEGRKMDGRPLFWHYPHYSGGLGGRPSGAIRSGDYKLIEFYEDNRVELYNLKNDISEKTDLAKSQPEKAEELKQLLHQWRKDVGAQMPFPNPAYIGQNNLFNNH
jgi:arylsulfatase A-like enzyme